MRHIYKLLSIAALTATAAMTTACEDYLDVAPKSSITVEDIFNSETETKAMLNTLYSYLTVNSLYGQNLPYAFDTNTDVEMRVANTELSTSGNGDDVHCFDMRAIMPALEQTWNQAYKTINYCNDFVENMQSSSLFSEEVGSEGPTNMQQMYGEAKCIRALLYFDLVRTFGDVVFRTKATTADDDFYGEGVTDRDKIYEWLINDLRDTEKYMLPASLIPEGVERASLEYCQGLIGQLALYRGGWSLRPGGSLGEMKRGENYEEFYRLAKEYLGKVIAAGNHSLANETFEQMWRRECNGGALVNGDVIFEIPMLAESSSNLGYRVGVTIGYNTEKPQHQFGGASNRTTLCGLYPFTFDPSDLRFDLTCVPIKYSENLSEELNFGSKAVAGWSIGKWNKLYMEKPLKTTAGNTGINAIRLRYADVLLMYAEVENELNGPTAEAKLRLKEVRTRAFLPEDQAVMVEDYVNALNTRDDFFKAIVNERAWEFGGEGIRKYDLARWNLYSQVIYDTFNKFLDWGYRASGMGVKGDVRDYVWTLESEDKESGRKSLEIVGLKKPIAEDEIPPASQGWKRSGYASEWWVLNNELGVWEAPDPLKWSFRNFINYSNMESVQPTDVLRYLMPYPSAVITAHRGSLVQFYGYR